MRQLEPPTETAADTYRLCVEAVRSSVKRSRLLSIEAAIAAAAQDYIRAAGRSALFRVAESPTIRETVTATELRSLYESHMARKGAAARRIYDRLLSAPKHKKCPLCGQRIVSTLDHYLPVFSHPSLSVLPHNLIPSCKDCNKEKGAALSEDAEHQTIHPYFDDFETERWLYGKILRVAPAAVDFYVSPPVHWSRTKKDRASYHFDLLKLRALYTAHAAEELVNIRHALLRIFERHGDGGVRSHLRTEAESRAVAHVNSWQTATYEALVADDWYCDGGFIAA